MYKWPLNVSNFTWLDRLKICSFFLNPKNFWTMNKKVQEFENEMSKCVGFEYSVFVSSGSTANTILAMYLRDKLKKKKSSRNIVVLPSTTWTTSCSPFLREGFEPYFIDISLDNFGMDLNKLKEYLEVNNEKIACVFPTALLGFNLDYSLLRELKEKYIEIEFFIDQCENNFFIFGNNSKHSNRLTSTTSTYMGHEIQSCEGGFIFTNNQEEYEKFLIYRNHGMVRGLNGTRVELCKSLYENKKVDPRFDFYSLGNNFRNSDINALIGILDIKRITKYIIKRKELYALFEYSLNKNRYILPYIPRYETETENTPFCIPIICRGDKCLERLTEIIKYCTENSIETRPIISGFLGYQTAYEGLMDEKDYPNSVYLHTMGIYIGLNTKIKKKNILKLTEFLNRI